MEFNQFGEMLKYARKEEKLSQNKLAEMAGITQTYLSQIETGHKKPNLKTIEDIAIALGRQTVIFFNKKND